MTLPVWPGGDVGVRPAPSIGSGSRAAGWALVACATLALAVGGMPAAEILARLALDVGMATLIGLLVAVCFLLPAEPRLSAASRRLLRVGVAAASSWCGAAVLSLVLSTTTLARVSLGEVAHDPQLLTVALDVPRGRALSVVVLVGLAAAVHLGTLRTRLEAQVLLGVVVAATLPLLASGHGGTDGHVLVAEATVLHVLAVAVWVGGLVAMVLLAGRPAELGFALPRFSGLALGCYVAAAAGGMVSAVAVLGAQADRWRSTYGTLVLLKLAALAVLGVAGWLHRRRTLPGVVAGTRSAFVRLATVEVAVMAAAGALGVATAVTAPPPGSLPDPGGSAHAALVHVGPVLLACGLLAVGAYGTGMLGARARGLRWPLRRAVAWACAVALTVVLVGAAHEPLGPTTSTATLVSGALVLPLLVIAAQPLELTRVVHERPSGWSPWRRPPVLADPTNAAALLLAGVVVVGRLGPQDRGAWPWWLSDSLLAAVVVVGLVGLTPLLLPAPANVAARTGKERSLLMVVLGLGLVGAGSRAAWVLGETAAGAWFVAGAAVLFGCAAAVARAPSASPTPT